MKGGQGGRGVLTFAKMGVDSWKNIFFKECIENVSQKYTKIYFK